MRKATILTAVLVAAGVLSGCVERQMTLVTEPKGAKAYYNDKYVGETPVTFHFAFYTAPYIRLEKDGYATLKAAPKVKVPAYERFPLDIFSEAVIPWTIYDRQTFNYTLEQTKLTDIPPLLQRADELGQETVKEK
jgi:hypothetical protein